MSHSVSWIIVVTVEWNSRPFHFPIPIVVRFNMKTLSIVRHAKSSWKYKALSDFERPLRKKGMEDLHAVITALRDKDVRPDFMMTSAAVRAIQTAVLLSQGLEMPQEAFGIRRTLYPGSCDQFFDCIKQFSEEYHSAMIVGHHPAVTDTINTLLGEDIKRVATSSVYCIQWDKADSWKQCLDEPGQLVFALKPKKL